MKNVTVMFLRHIKSK